MKQFKNTLKSLRKFYNLSGKQLAELSHVPSSVISATEHGKRNMGETTSTRIAKALGLEGDLLTEFVLQAMEESDDRLLAISWDFPVALLNKIPILLREKGVSSDSIRKYTDNNKDATLTLKDGKHVHISIQIHHTALQMN